MSLSLSFQTLSSARITWDDSIRILPLGVLLLWLISFYLYGKQTHTLAPLFYSSWFLLWFAVVNQYREEKSAHSFFIFIVVWQKQSKDVLEACGNKLFSSRLSSTYTLFSTSTSFHSLFCLILCIYIASAKSKHRTAKGHFYTWGKFQWKNKIVFKKKKISRIVTPTV